ncbi:hypothetical protein NM208_g15729 [Fusarium decemcellulare]|uniref:Uncharacterized protein n=1 Tax=Fusarium decemcellulare TaxID=57161 RepID=A0ACC1RC74_9HYPO|nr:hypothetical protein NM208_g15729 [Fusarium decemcellulare]
MPFQLPPPLRNYPSVAPFAEDGLEGQEGSFDTDPAFAVRRRATPRNSALSRNPLVDDTSAPHDSLFTDAQEPQNKVPFLAPAVFPFRSSFSPASFGRRLGLSLPATMGNTTSAVLDNLVQGSNFDRDEVDRLRKRFMKLDKDNSGTIERDEFLSLPQISSNPLATRMIAIFDEDGGGDVDFQEFVTGLSAFSSKGNKEQKLQFAFKVYDIDRDGYISNGELFIVLKMMVGSNLKDQQLQQIVDKTIMEADLDKDGKISFEEFTKMVENTDVSMSMTVGVVMVSLGLAKPSQLRHALATQLDRAMKAMKLHSETPLMPSRNAHISNHGRCGQDMGYDVTATTTPFGFSPGRAAVREPCQDAPSWTPHKFGGKQGWRLYSPSNSKANGGERGAVAPM